MANAGEEDLEARMRALGRAAREAQRLLASVPRESKDRALRAAAAELRTRRHHLVAVNSEDLAEARARGLSAAMLDRLALDEKRIEAMARGLEEIAELPDPVGTELARWTRPNGLDIARVRVPLGVIGVIYESRPNVTADAGGLCLKAGNAVILRGGSESFRSSAAILGALHAGLDAAGLPRAAIQMVPTSDRQAVGYLLRMSEFVDVIVPRGGKSLIERVYAESRIPVLAHLEGNCHTYLHESADLDMAIAVTVNAKLRRTGICGATETLLCDRAAAPRLLPPVLDALILRGCEIRGCPETRALEPRAKPATEEDWYTEYLDAVLAVKVVSGLDEAIEHIERYGSHHTDAIIAQDRRAAEIFLARVDSAIVMHNASTQFADGGEFGMGAEIGIATGRLHARGPVGVEQLTTFKYVVRGNGQCRPG
ncbi:MAG: glutamate-5-semialdehyde dehydrogenase [Geminicoccaceae bacterium]|nr:glutamate-5-semialdehyde dehydrogenase [Geminicoccaceae bacterium]